MKIREKLPFMSGSGPQETETAAVAVADPPAPAAPEPQQTRSSDGLSEALDTVARVMVGEVDSLRRSITELEERTAKRIDAEKKATAAAVDGLRQSQHKTLNEAVNNLRELLQRYRDQAADRNKEVRAGLEEILSAKEHKLEKGLTALADKLAEVRGGLAQQIEASGHTSALLENVASVFKNQKARQPGAAASAPAADDREAAPDRAD